MTQMYPADYVPGDWRPYEAEGDGYVPVERWGKDHWSTLAYLETRAVDHKGVVTNANMRTHARLHRELVGVMFDEIQDGSAYPTRLRGDETLDRHDDWSCLEDMVAAGLLRSFWRVKHHGRTFGGNEVRVEFTDAGLELAGQLRAHKAGGGAFADFVPALEATQADVSADAAPPAAPVST